MRSSTRDIALATGAMWGGCMLTIGLLNMVNRSYGRDFLRVMSSVYPGADTKPTIGRVLLGGAYGVVDGACAGLAFAGILRALSKTHVHGLRGLKTFAA